MYRKYEINCPVCGCYISSGEITLGCKQRIENKECKNGHLLAIDNGGVRTHIMVIEINK